MTNPLRIAIIVSKSNKLPAWEYTLFNNLCKENYIAELVFVISNDSPVSYRKSYAYRLFTAFENWWFRSDEEAVKEIGLSGKLVSESEALSIDFDIIYLSSTVSSGYQPEITSRFGVWRIIFGVGKYKNGIPTAFWEVMNNEAVTGSSLVVRYKGRKLTVYDGTTVTIPYSVKNNINHLSWKSSSFLQYRLKEFFESGPNLFFDRYFNKNDDYIFNPSMQLLPPESLEMVWLFKKNVFRYLVTKIRQKIQKSRFTIMVSNKTFESTLPIINSFIPLPLSKEKFIADPFVVNQNGNDYIFFEEYVYAKNKAHISVIEVNKDGTMTNARTVLEKPYHLSYPFVFKWQGEWYMIPETAANNTVELYRCNQFPYQWELIKYLFKNTLLIDCTLWYHDNRWWLFAVTQNHALTTTNDQLLLFYSEDLFSTGWKAHPQNPVVTDISNCRPAGRIFSKNGNYYRPAQNNASKQYGYGVKLNRIEVINEFEYRETLVDEYNPENIKYLKAVHTYNFSENFSVIDGILKK